MATCVTETSAVSSRILNPAKFHPIQNFTLIWLDPSIHELDHDSQYALAQLRYVVPTIHIFTNVDRCLDFLNQTEKVKVFLIIPGNLGQSILPGIHGQPDLDSIYIFYGNKARHEQWAKRWLKIKGVYTKIDTLCGILKEDIELCERSSMPFSVTTNDVNHLDPSFMYTQLLKEILLEMDYDDEAKRQFVQLCRNLYWDSEEQLKIIDEFESHYDEHTPIWWYTRECFTYQLLNRALRTQDVKILIKIGFFLHDVHRHIERVHSESRHSDDVFIVYRGQGMSITEFEKIKRRSGGLFAFNSFLSTSSDETVSMKFAKTLSKIHTQSVFFSR